MASASSNGFGKRQRDSPTVSENEVEACSSSEPSSKRLTMELTAPQQNTSTTRPECPFGQECYRRNPIHFRENRHSALEDLFVRIMQQNPGFTSLPIQIETTDREILLQQLKLLRDIKLLDIIRAENGRRKYSEEENISNSNASDFNAGTSSCVAETRSTLKSSEQTRVKTLGTMLEKWEASSPYNFFLTRLPFEESSVGFAVSFGEIFDPSFGEIKAICHFNFLVEAEWFLDETQKASLEGKETTIIYGVETPELTSATEAFPWLKVHLSKSPFPFGHHHTKMILIQYTDESLRFVVSTANLTEGDWEKRTQGVWISPRCPKATEQQKSEFQIKCPGNFQSDLLQYLSSYPAKFLSSWIPAIRGADCSQIKVVFVASAPTTAQSSSNGFQWGLKKMEKVLKSFPLDEEVDPSWPLVMQCSSIATLGSNDEWVRGELGSPMLGSKWSPSTPIRLVYPSDANVRASFDGVAGGGCLPYQKNTHSKQGWVQKILYQWKAGLRDRTRAVPHIKTYCRMSPDQTKMAWFLLTSANLSKAAWGKLSKNRDRLSMMSWEAGVLFIPHLFGSSESFQISKTSERDASNSSEFILPYDVPLQKYGLGDTPWFIDTLLALKPSD